MMDEVECPYCEAYNEIDHDGPAFYQEDHGVQLECSECGKNFLVWGSCSWSWEGTKADCLNGNPHKWSEWRDMWEDESHPGEVYQRRYCTDCDETQMQWNKKETAKDTEN